MAHTCLSDNCGQTISGKAGFYCLMRKRWPLSAMCSPPGLVEAASEMTFQMAELQHYRLFNKAPFWHEPSMHRFGCFFGCFLRWKPARCLFVIRAVGPRLGGEVGPLGHSLVLGLWKESLGMKWCRVGGGRGPSCFSICTCGYSTSFPGGCLSGEDIEPSLLLENLGVSPKSREPPVSEAAC